MHKYGWVKDAVDDRDLVFEPQVGTLPASVDLRAAHMPPVVDQGQLGSCTANAIAGALGYDQLKQGEVLHPLSRLFIYYCERDMEGSVREDSGAQIRDGIKCVHTFGAPPETEWPYNIANFTHKPTVKAYTDAVKFESVLYRRVTHGVNNLKAALAAGFPVVFGFTVYDSFESAAVAQTGVVPMPAAGESVLGGHAVVAVGYDDSQNHVIVRNSWGTGWGQSGYCFMPYCYFTKAGLSSDWWTVTAVK